MSVSLPSGKLHKPAQRPPRLPKDLSYWLVAALALGLGGLALVGWLAYGRMSETIAAERWENHTYVVIREMDRLLSELRDAETSQQGFVITGKAEYLAPYRQSIAQVERRLADLRRLTADNPLQQQRMAAIEGAIREKVAELRDTIGLRDRQGLDAAVDTIGTDRGKDLMERITRQIGELEAEEQSLLKERERRKIVDTERTIQLVVAGGLLSGALLGAVFFLLQREVIWRRRAGLELKRQHDTLSALYAELDLHRHHLEDLVETRTAEVKATMAQFRILIEQAPTAMAMFDRNFKYLAASRRWIKEFAANQSRLAGQHIYVAHPDLPEHWKDSHQAALAGATLRNDEDLWSRADTKRWLSWVIYPWTDGAGQVGGIIIAAEDITERKRTEEELRASEIRLRATFEQAAVGIAHLDMNGRWLRLNQKFCDIVGYSREELLELRFQDITHPDDVDADEAQANAVRVGAIPSYVMEKRYVRKDGSVVWINLTVSLVQDAAGKPDYFISVVEDIQRRKEIEFALEEEREIFRNLSQISSDYFWEQDEHFRFISYSQGIALRSGMDPRDYLGKARWEISYIGMEPEDWAGHRALLDSHLPFRNLELGQINREGEERWFNISGDPIFSKDGEFKGYRGTSQDITERKATQKMLESYQKHLEQEVAKRTAELMAANKELQGFTYAASHDIKGPLGRINSFSTLLEKNYRERLEGDGLLFLDLIRRNATRLAALVDDMLAHAQIEQHILDLHPVDLQGAVRAVLNEKEEDIREGKAELHVDVPAVQVQANGYALGQVLRNLVENAIKYSSQSRPPVIHIGARVEDGRCRLWVRDNGVGFSMEYHDRVFEIFRRLHTYEEFPGSGVGLALVKKAMDRMGGRVWAESQPGQGAIFYLELPA